MNIRRFFRRLEPRAMAMITGPFGDKIRPWIDRHDVLNFGRHPLAKGVAFGLLCGLLPFGPIQMTATVLLCIRWHGNALVGIVTTLYSNVFTMLPLYLLSFKLGQWIIGDDKSVAAPDMSALTQSQGMISGSIEGLLSMGWPLIVGIPVLSTILAMIGYGVMQFLWVLPIYRRARRLRKIS